MEIKPILTEKSLNSAKAGMYSFWVKPSMTKSKIKELIKQLFEVKVDRVRTLNYKKTIKKNWKGKLATKSARKKALVTLKDGKKIDLFETEKSGTAKKAKK